MTLYEVLLLLQLITVIQRDLLDEAFLVMAAHNQYFTDQVGRCDVGNRPQYVPGIYYFQCQTITKTHLRLT